MSRILSLLFALFLLSVVVVGMLFYTRNQQSITIDFYAGTIQASLPIVMVGCVGVGVVLGFLAAIMAIMSEKNDKRRLKREINAVRGQVSADRALPYKHAP